MDTTPLGVFASKARASNRLLYGDLRRLRRDVLPTGARSREEVETLLSLDRIERVDEDWPQYLVRTVCEFVLTCDPPGAIDGETAGWLVTALAQASHNTATAIVRTLASKAYHVDEALSALAGRRAKRSVIAAAPKRRARGRGSPAGVARPRPLAICGSSPDLSAAEAAHPQISP